MIVIKRLFIVLVKILVIILFVKVFNEYNLNNINFIASNDKVNPNDSKEEDDDDNSNQSSVYSEIYKD